MEATGDSILVMTMAAGSEAPIRFEAKNTGSTTWPAHGTPPFRFGYHWADPKGRGNCDSVVWWLSSLRRLIEARGRGGAG